MTNGHDDKFRSRKWMLAVYSEITNTIGAAVLQGMAFLLVWKGKVPADVYADMAIAIGYVWMFGTGIVLGGYGFANVMEKWKPDK